MAPTQPLIVITWICSQNPECVNRVETSWPKDSSPMGQPQGLPLQFVLAVLKRGTLGARASGPHPRVAPKVTQGPMSIGRGTLKAGDSGSDHTSKMGLLPIPPVTRPSAGMTCWGGIGRRECFLSRVKRKNRFPSRGRWCRVAASSSGRSNSTGSTGRSRPGGVETTTHGKKRDRTGRR